MSGFRGNDFVGSSAIVTFFSQFLIVVAVWITIGLTFGIVYTFVGYYKPTYMNILIPFSCVTCVEGTEWSSTTYMFHM